MVELSTPIEELTRVGKTTASRLHRLGISTARDLLFHFPHRYEEWGGVKLVKDLQPNQSISIQGEIAEIKNFKSPRKRMQLTEAYVKDETGSVKILWFNQGFLKKNLPVGTKVLLRGKTELSGRELLLKSPQYEIIRSEDASDIRHSTQNEVMPIYPLSLNLTQKQLRFLVDHIIVLASNFEDPLPEALRTEHDLVHISTALRWIHQPESMDQVKQAQKRFAFEELFYLQLQSAYLRNLNESIQADALTFFEDELKAFVDALPYELTGDQKKTAFKIFLDLQKDYPMNRLVQGDVGSGKTVVATMAMYNVSLNGKQSALLAPTEVLASQHFTNITQLLAEYDVPVALLTRTQSVVSHKGKQEFFSKTKLIQQIQEGAIAITIGTHAILQPDIEFKDLGIAIIDEQHRFGVEQRKRLREQSGNMETIPHLLSMTATPIPRTLSLVLYGDLHVSSIREMPKNRKPIETKFVSERYRKDAYAFVASKLKEGDQVYVVCPLIEESDSLGVTSVTQEAERLAKVFSSYQMGVLHGKLKSTEKEAIMQSFKSGELDLLIATTVIEVGVDVPNATIMLIEGAERFGLSQLHQIRGRVGRGEKQSHCLLFATDESGQVTNRLRRFIDCRDGFDVAELDLQLRGSGEVFGKKQSGAVEFRFANLDDAQFIESVNEIAQTFLDQHDLSDFPLLFEHIKRLNESVHLE